MQTTIAYQESGVKIEEQERFLLSCLFFGLLALPLCLMLVRGMDNNTLVSWQWTMGDRQPLMLSGLLCLFLLAAYFYSNKKVAGHAPLVLGAIAFVVALPFVFKPEPVVDAGRYFLQARNVSENGLFGFWGQWGKTIFIWTDLPGVPFLHGLWMAVWGDGWFSSRILSLLFFAALVAVNAQLGRQIWGEETGLYAGWLIMASPFLLYLAPAYLVDIPAAFFSVAAMSFLLQFVRQGGVRLGAAAVTFLVAALFAKFSLWLFLPVLTIGLLAGTFCREHWRQQAVRVAVIWGAALLVVCIYVAVKHEIIREQLALLFSYQAAGLGRWGESFVSGFFFQIHPVVIILAGAALLVAFRNKERSMLFPFTAILLVIVLPTSRIRYLVPLIPFVCLAAARGLSFFALPRARRFVALGAVATSFCVTLTAYLPFARSTALMNIAEAGQYINTLPGNMLRVATVGEKGVMDVRALIPMIDMVTTKDICIEAGNLNKPAFFQTSSLRFTWEMDISNVYNQCGVDRGHHTRVMVSDVHGSATDASDRQVVFTRKTDAFVFRPQITVFSETEANI